MVQQAEIGIVDCLTQMIREENGDLLLEALEVLLNISTVHGNALAIVSPEHRLYDALLSILNDNIASASTAATDTTPAAATTTGALRTSYSQEAQLMALRVLLNISIPEENRLYLASADFGFIDVLVKLLSGSSSKSSRQRSSFSPSTSTSSYKSSVSASPVRMLSSGVSIQSSSSSDALDEIVAEAMMMRDETTTTEQAVAADAGAAAVVLSNVSMPPDFDHLIPPPDTARSTAVDSIVDTDAVVADAAATAKAVEERRKIIQIILQILLNLTMDFSSLQYLGSKKLGLIRALVSKLRSNQLADRLKVLTILTNLAENEANKEHFASAKVGLISRLLHLLKNGEEKEKLGSLTLLWNIVNAVQSAKVTATPAVELLHQLVDIVRTDKDKLRALALRILGCLSVAIGTQLLLASPEFGLLPVLMTTIAEVQGAVRDDALLLLRMLVTLTTSSGGDDAPFLSGGPDIGIASRSGTGPGTGTGFSTAIAIGSSSGSSGDKELLELLMNLIRGVRDDGNLKRSDNGCNNVGDKIAISGGNGDGDGDGDGVVSDGNGESRIIALNILHHLSNAEENKIAFASEELGLVALLIDIIKSTDIIVKPKNEFSRRGNRYSDDTGNDNYNISNDNADYGNISKVNDCGDSSISGSSYRGNTSSSSFKIDYSKGGHSIGSGAPFASQSWALDILSNIATIDANKATLSDPRFGLFDALLYSLKETTSSDVRGKSLKVFLQTASSSEVQLHLVISPNRDLMQALALIVADDSPGGHRRSTTLKVLQDVSLIDENVLLMLQPQITLIAILIDVVKNDSGKPRMRALGILSRIAQLPEGKRILSAPELGFTQALEQLKSAEEEDGDTGTKVAAEKLYTSLHRLSLTSSSGRTSSGLSFSASASSSSSSSLSSPSIAKSK
jgi:hypothetical protein